MIEVKICGVASRADIDAAAEAGADYVGVHVFYDSSPRAVSAEEAAALAEHAEAAGLKPVAVTADPDGDALAALGAAGSFLFLQLNGAESPQDVERIAQATGLRVIKSLQAATPQELARREEYEDAHAFVFNPKGEWGILRGAFVARPWFLAGGLTADNVADAVHASGALAVDVSTGVESDDGAKDLERMRAFVDAAQEGE